MRLISVFLILTICLSFIGCSTGVKVDVDNDGKDDSKINIVIPNYTVSFQSNGGTRVSSMNVSELLTAPQTTRDGHEFRGWYRDESLTVPVVYPLKLNSDITLYAKWLKTEHIQNCYGDSIKFMDEDYNSSLTYLISPPGFDLTTLELEGYKIRISVEYDVYYKKDYDVLWDIGYMGAPKYEVSIYNSDKLGNFNEDLTTATYSQTRTIEYSGNASHYRSTQIYLTFSTNNIQNVIYFDNIKITYTCYK